MRVLFVLAARGGERVTRGRIWGKDQPFNAWCRLNLRDAQRGLTISDLDLVLFRWDAGRLALAEVKTRGSTVPFAQADLLRVLDQLLAAGAAAGPVETARGRRSIDYRGLHVVRLEGLDPDRSAWVELDGRLITREELVDALNLEHMGGCHQ